MATGATLVQGKHDAMVEFILAQRLAVRLAELRGLDSYNPRDT